MGNAGEIGLDVAKFKKDLADKSDAYDQQIQDDMKLGMTAAVRGTPTYFINGKKTRSRTVEQYQVEIDKLLK